MDNVHNYSQTKSERFEEYIDFFNSISCQSDMSNYEQRFKSHRINFDKSRKIDQKSISILNKS